MHRTPCPDGRAAARAAGSRPGGVPAPPRGHSGESVVSLQPGLTMATVTHRARRPWRSRQKLTFTAAGITWAQHTAHQRPIVYFRAR